MANATVKKKSASKAVPLPKPCTDCGNIPGTRGAIPVPEGWSRLAYNVTTGEDLRGLFIDATEIMRRVKPDDAILYEELCHNDPAHANEYRFVANFGGNPIMAYRVAKLLNAENPRKQTEPKVESVTVAYDNGLTGTVSGKAAQPKMEAAAKAAFDNSPCGPGCTDAGCDPREHGDKPAFETPITSEEFAATYTPDWFIRDLKRWSKNANIKEELCEGSNRRLKLYINDHSYAISVYPPDEKRPNGYMGCIVSAVHPNEGESWTRGNDLADGPYGEHTWNKIMLDIVSYELVPDKPKSKTVATKVTYSVDMCAGNRARRHTLCRLVTSADGASSTPIATFHYLPDAEWLRDVLNGLDLLEPIQVPRLIHTSPLIQNNEFVSNMKSLAGRVLTVVDVATDGTKNVALKTLIRKEFREQMSRYWKHVFEPGCEQAGGDPEADTEL